MSLNDIRYDTIDEFNEDSKAEYSALSSTRSQKKETKTNNASASLICQLITIIFRLLTSE